MTTITELCTGCRACEMVCPKTCINMAQNKEGFIMPQIDQSLCIDCSVCTKICPQNKEMEGNEVKRTLAVRYKNEDLLYKAASGGAFAAIASFVISEGGIVYGAAYNNDLSVSHCSAETLNELEKLLSSKYVQSDTGVTFKKVKNELQNARLVLYSGVPCQIAGLKSYLKKDYDNLLTIDLICHGVASPKLFAKYLLWLGKKQKGKILFYDFRDKKNGWGLECKTKTKTKTKFLSASLDPYYFYFLRGYTYRECCYHCHYTKPQRISDITIGDYWGIEKEHRYFYSTKGVSLALINTEKGQNTFYKIKDNFFICESTFEKAATHNENLLQPTRRPICRDTIYQNIDNKDAVTFFNEDFQLPFNLKARIKNLLPSRLKLIIKQIKL